MMTKKKMKTHEEQMLKRWASDCRDCFILTFIQAVLLRNPP